ncbi:MAG: 3-hydroxyacyl-ACP dehydratase FabZ [Chitinivibrionales bacterium]|nr:3-hydroxyacyl-ACP dehydratase FabZ [Chitinivibrionales bacterium]
MFSIEEITRYVPHRYPFLLIDRVLEFEADRSVKVLKNVSINEAQFQGHFPEKPVFPGVYIIESMAQASCFLLAKSAGGIDPDAVYVLGKVAKMSFFELVIPGDQLITTVQIEKKLGDNAMVRVRSTVGDKLAAKGELMFAARTGKVTGEGP